jgi:enoyl-CoA hydratase/carnithine racemase
MILRYPRPLRPPHETSFTSDGMPAPTNHGSLEMSELNTEAPVIEMRSGAVAWIRINRPRKRNALDSSAREALASAFAAAGDDAEVRVIVLTGVGGAFCSGTDLSGVTSDETHVLARNPMPLVAPVEGCPKPVIAAVNGPAVGGGFELALASELRVASTNAVFRLPEVMIGSLPGSGGTQRLFSALPSAIAWRMLLAGDALSAEEALRFGLVSEVFEVDQFEEDVEALAQRVASAAPLSLRAAKLAGGVAAERGLSSGLSLERVLWAFLSTTEDRAEGREAFREKRSPVFRER